MPEKAGGTNFTQKIYPDKLLPQTELEHQRRIVLLYDVVPQLSTYNDQNEKYYLEGLGNKKLSKF